PVTVGSNVCNCCSFAPPSDFTLVFCRIAPRLFWRPIRMASSSDRGNTPGAAPIGIGSDLRQRPRMSDNDRKCRKKQESQMAAAYFRKSFWHFFHRTVYVRSSVAVL